MAQVTFLGATGTVTGSKYLLDLNDNRFLVDCGMFQGAKENRKKNWETLSVPPASIDRVFLTHAHIDHTGYLPRLCRDGFAGPVHCTHATAELCDILLRDSAHLQEEDAYWANKKGYSKHRPARPLYTVEDAEKAISYLSPLYFGEDFRPSENVRIKLRDAGHMLGASFVDVKTRRDKRERKILFSGDLGRASRPILRDPEQAYNVDYLVLESTYGDRLHQPGSPIEELARVITESAQRGGALVAPSFAIGRTQALLYVICELEEAGRIPRLPVYVDSPMAIEATEVFERRVPELDMDSRLRTIRGSRIFRPADLHICKSREESKAINDVAGPAIIISSSGMAVGGRILHHLKKRLPDKATTVLLIGFQAYGTRGRSLLEGQSEIKIHGRMVPVGATVETILGFSAHADYHEILAWLMGFNRPPEKTFIVHGEPEASAAMAERIRDRFGWETVIPELGDSFELDL